MIVTEIMKRKMNVSDFSSNNRNWGDHNQTIVSGSWLGACRAGRRVLHYMRSWGALTALRVNGDEPVRVPNLEIRPGYWNPPWAVVWSRDNLMFTSSSIHPAKWLSIEGRQVTHLSWLVFSICKMGFCFLVRSLMENTQLKLWTYQESMNGSNCHL